MNMAFTHFRAAYAFMGYQSPIQESKIAIIPVPYDGTTSYKGGTRNGPHAIITASRQVELYDIELKKELAAEIGIHTYDEIEPDLSSPEKTVKKIKDITQEALEKKQFPIVLGGEHTVALGAIKACAEKHGEISVLHIDAHADLRESYEGTKYNHACVMRRVQDITKKTVSIGIRSMCKEEAEFIKKQKIEMQYGSEINTKKVLANLSDKVYITFDLDGLDPSEAPAVGTPEPGGLRYNKILELIKEVAQKKNIVGFDINELSPIAGENRTEFLAAKLTYKMLNYIFFSHK